MTTTKQGGIKDIAVGRSDIFRLDPADIRVREGWNLRNTETAEYKAGIIDLKNQIVAAGGVKEALTVQWEDGAPWLTNGHRRLEAVKLALSEGHEINFVPVQTEGRNVGEVDCILSMILRNSGVPFTPMENAGVFKRLQDLGLTLVQIGEKVGYTEARVRQTIDLLSMPEPVKAHIDAGTVAPTTAAEVVKRVGRERAGSVIEAGVKKAEEKGRKKVMRKDVADLLGDDPEPERKVIGKARTAPLDLAESRAEGMEPDDDDDVTSLYDKLKFGRDSGKKFVALMERIHNAVVDAKFTDETFAHLTVSRKLYEDLCDALGIAPKEPE